MGGRLIVRSGGGLLVLMVFFQCALSFANQETPEKLFPYILSPGRDAPLLTVGAAVSGVGLYMSMTLESPTDAELTALDRDDVPRFDRPAIGHNSDPARTVSNVGLISLLTIPSLLLLPELLDLRARWRNGVTLITMYVETLMLTWGITMITKVLVGRARPIAYDDRIPEEERLEENFTAFFSGHTSLSFCGATFATTVFFDLFPDTPWRFVVLGLGLAWAATTGTMRYLGGKHFPSDILVGAIVGSTFGFGVPLAHRRRYFEGRHAAWRIVPQVTERHVGLASQLTF